MRQTILFMALLGIAGCAPTYSELRERAPLYQERTTMTPQAFVDCVLPKWLDQSALTHIIKDGDSRVVVMPRDGYVTVPRATLTASPSTSGSLVVLQTKFYSTANSKTKKMWAAAQACK